MASKVASTSISSLPFPPISSDELRANPLISSTIPFSTFQTPRRSTVATTYPMVAHTSSDNMNSIPSVHGPIDSLKTKLDVQYTPINSELGEWWDEHAKYSKFSRQGIDIVCVSFEQKHKHITIANVIILCGWSSSFLRYVELVKLLYENHFNIQMFDYQSHGLSGRWLPESQSLWVNSFDDYVDDFVYFTTLVNKEHSKLPLYVIGDCLGGLIASIAMAKLPYLINRAVLVAPMLRLKCALKFFNYHIFLPQPIVRWLAICCIQLGLGTMHAFGFSLEKPSDDPLHLLNVTTTDEEQLLVWHSVKQRIPEVMSTCVTFDWIYQAIHAQRKFSTRYEFVRTNTLIFNAEHDKFVYDRAMKLFLKKSNSSQLFTVRDAYHDLLHESPGVRHTVTRMILNFFLQNSDNVFLVESEPPLVVKVDKECNLYSMRETVVRAIGVGVSCAMFITGCALIFGRSRIR